MHNEDNYFDKEQMLDEVLKAEPGFTLSDNFAFDLAKIVDRKIAWANYWNEFLIYLGAIVGIAIIWIAVLFLFFEADWKEWLNFLTGNLMLVLGSVVLIVFVLFADRVLLRYFMNKPFADAG